MKRIFSFLLAMILFTSLSFSKETRLLRYPNTSSTQITFVYGGDVFVAPIKGGLARRITSYAGYEMFPRFSPDGRTIAFSGEYDGNREVYTIPSIGGEPTRLTYSVDIPGLPDRMGPDKIIMQWSNNGEKILYRSRQTSWTSWVGKLYWVDINGGLPEEVPLPRSGFASLSPDGSKLAYNRMFREFRTWKRYRGGQADDIWIYDFNTKKIENITNNPAQDIIPMWYKDKVYYVSDRDHWMNIFEYDLKTKQTKKVTDFRKYDVKFPSIGGDYISFENGGYIYLLDLKTDNFKKVEIQVAEDFTRIRPTIQNVKNNINSWDIAPDGNRALFEARGDIFTVPAKHGKTYNLTQTPGVHDRNPEWSPDGKWIAFISDKSGENEIYLTKSDGSGLTQLTDNSKSYLWSLMWSPDSKKIMFSDKALGLYYVDIDSKKITKVTKSKIWEIRDYKWSPDNKWIAYTDYINNYIPQIYLYSLKNDKSYKITSDFFQNYNPVFAPSGKYLFFLSDRTFRPKVGSFEWNFMYEKMTTIFGITLQDTLKSPFAFKNDKVKIKEDKTDKSKKSKKKKDKKEDKTIKIDLKNIQDRIFELPVKSSNYRLIGMIKSKLYYNREGKLWSYDLYKKEEKEVGKIGISGFSADGKKIMFKKGRDYYITNIAAKISATKGKLDLTDLTVNLDRRKEWKQIFNEGWQQMKYFFYDPNMHGLDWNAMKEKYGQLVPYAVSRADLTYIMGELIGELNIGHSYVGGGDLPKIKKVGVGLLGCDYTFDESSGFYKISKILEGRNWEEKTRSPLTEPGVTVKKGDYLIAIDGVELSKSMTPYRALLGKANKYVTLKINTNADEDGAKEYNVKTIATENGLRYYNWVENNRKIVDKATNGQVAYIHIPDMMMNNGLNEFVKYFYPQIRKKGLIVDDRYNGGGNVSPMIIERLRRILLLAKHARNQEEVMTNPDAVMTGPIVCLLNQLSASDGDLFPYEFRQAKLGTLIGKRSWGGVIGIRGSLPFLDGGYMYKPEFSSFGTNGKWVIEGHGVDPDIEIGNDPTLEYKGIDQQLNKAIEVVLKQIKTNKKPQIPKVPPFPDKSK